MATLVTRYVNTDTGSSGGSGEANDPYNSIVTAWNSLATEYSNSLVTADVQVDLYCTGLTPLDAQTLTTALEQDSTRFLRIIGDWIGPTWDNTKFRIITNGTRGLYFGNISKNFTKVYNIQSQVNNTVNSDIYGFFASGANLGIEYHNCIADVRGTTSVRPYGFSIASSSGDVVLRNCVALAPSGVTGSICFRSTAGNIYFLNCTAIGGHYGFRAESGTLIAKNCGSYGAATAGFAGGLSASCNYNASSDATAPGTTAYHSVNPTFVDAANGDYRLDPSDTAWKDKGTDLSTDTYPVTDDLLGNPRVAPYDIGAFEVQVVASPDFEVSAPFRRSIGYNITMSDGSDPAGTTVGTITYIDDSDWISDVTLGASDGTTMELTITCSGEAYDALVPGTYRATIALNNASADNDGDTITVTLVVS